MCWGENRSVLILIQIVLNLIYPEQECVPRRPHSCQCPLGRTIFKKGMDCVELFYFLKILMNTSHAIHTFLIILWSKRYGLCGTLLFFENPDAHLSRHPYLFDHFWIKKVWIVWEVCIRNFGKLKRFSYSIPFSEMRRPHAESLERDTVDIGFYGF